MKYQTTILDSQKWKEWRHNLDRIEQNLILLYTAREMFKRLYSLFNNHENLKKCPNKIFFTHLWNTYVVYLGMGIRRLVDKGSKALNLYKLLEDMKKNIGQLCVDNYAEYFFKKCHEKRIESNNTNNCEKKFLRESYHRDAHKMACRAFEDALGREIRFVRCCDVEEDIKKIEKGPKEKIEKFVNKCWAHMDTKKPVKIELDVVHKALDLLISIYNKYSLLTAGGVFDQQDIDIKLFAGWDAPFRIPWTE